MTDIVTKNTRSRMMRGIKSRNTKPEILVRAYLHSIGFRFRLTSKIGRIRPDIVLPKYKTCIFIHGCFWHRHRLCKLASSPKSNTDFWLKKFRQNIERDKRINEELKQSGWTVGVIWECSVRDQSFKELDYSILIKPNNSFWAT